ncbi:MAG TPA: 4a-hydroxytetrahydrobiopterin dehydratase [Balneola sp.]|nr:4a-hydroxytetrahydrobiopterin dehydratase [Balneola sp.]
MKPLSEQEINSALESLEGWGFDDDKLWKKFEFGNFKEALAIIVRVGVEAELQTHHPRIFNVYNTVTIGLQTHDAGDKVTQNDVDLATAIEGII